MLSEAWNLSQTALSKHTLLNKNFKSLLHNYCRAILLTQRDQKCMWNNATNECCFDLGLGRTRSEHWLVHCYIQAWTNVAVCRRRYFPGRKHLMAYRLCHGCWCPGSSSWQVLSSLGISYRSFTSYECFKWTHGAVVLQNTKDIMHEYTWEII